MTSVVPGSPAAKQGGIHAEDIILKVGEKDKEPVDIRLRLPASSRHDTAAVESVRLLSRNGTLISLGELARLQPGVVDLPIYHKNLRPVNFVCNATLAQSVSLVGDFNEWNPGAHPMKQMPDRSWLLKVDLKHGHHRYAFLVDGVLTLDPRAQGITRNDKGERVSLVPVS